MAVLSTLSRDSGQLGSGVILDTMHSLVRIIEQQNIRSEGLFEIKPEIKFGQFDPKALGNIVTQLAEVMPRPQANVSVGLSGETYKLMIDLACVGVVFYGYQTSNWFLVTMGLGLIVFRLPWVKEKASQLWAKMTNKEEEEDEDEHSGVRGESGSGIRSEAGSAAVTFAGGVLLMRLVDAFGYCSSMPEAFKAAESLASSKLNHNSVGAIELFLTMIQNVANTVISFATGNKDDFFNFVNPKSIEVHKDVEEIKDMLVAWDSHKMHPDELLMHLDTKAQSLNKNMKKLPENSILFKQATALMTKVNACLHSVKVFLNNNSGSRPVPVAMLFIGEPGIGKTWMTDNISMYFIQNMCSPYMMDYYKRHPESLSKAIYSLNQTDQYMSGWRGPTVVHIDEFATKSPVAGQASTPSRMLGFINSCACPLNMADLADKGNNFMTAKVILGTSNNRNWSDLEGVEDCEAFFRRVKFVEVELDYEKAAKEFGGEQADSLTKDELKSLIHAYQAGHTMRFTDNPKSMPYEKYLDLSYAYHKFWVHKMSKHNTQVTSSGVRHQVQPSQLLKSSLEQYNQNVSVFDTSMKLRSAVLSLSGTATKEDDIVPDVREVLESLAAKGVQGMVPDEPEELPGSYNFISPPLSETSGYLWNHLEVNPNFGMEQNDLMLMLKVNLHFPIYRDLVRELMCTDDDHLALAVNFLFAKVHGFSDVVPGFLESDGLDPVRFAVALLGVWWNARTPPQVNNWVYHMYDSAAVNMKQLIRRRSQPRQDISATQETNEARANIKPIPYKTSKEFYPGDPEFATAIFHHFNPSVCTNLNSMVGFQDRMETQSSCRSWPEHGPPLEFPKRTGWTDSVVDSETTDIKPLRIPLPPSRGASDCGGSIGSVRAKSEPGGLASFLARDIEMSNRSIRSEAGGFVAEQVNGWFSGLRKLCKRYYTDKDGEEIDYADHTQTAYVEFVNKAFTHAKDKKMYLEAGTDTTKFAIAAFKRVGVNLSVEDAELVVSGAQALDTKMPPAFCDTQDEAIQHVACHIKIVLEIPEAIVTAHLGVETKMNWKNVFVDAALVGAVAALAIGAWKFLGSKLSNSESDYALKQVKSKQKKARSPVSRVPGVQSESPGIIPSFTTKVMCNNIVYFKVVVQEGFGAKSWSSHLTMLQNRVAVIPRHVMEKLQDSLEQYPQARLIFCKPQHAKEGGQVFTKWLETECALVDHFEMVGGVLRPKAAVRLGRDFKVDIDGELEELEPDTLLWSVQLTAKDISKNLMTDKEFDDDLSTHQIGTAVFQGSAFNYTSGVAKKEVNWREVREVGNSDDFLEMAEDGTRWFGDRLYKYTGIGNKPGFCGIPIVSEGRSGSPKVLGVHVAGNPTQNSGYCCFFSKEDFAVAMRQLSMVTANGACVLRDIPEDIENLEDEIIANEPCLFGEIESESGCFTKIGVVPGDVGRLYHNTIGKVKPPILQKKTKLVHSPLFFKIPGTGVAPARLSPFTNRDGQFVDPGLVAQTGYGKCSIGPNCEMVSAIVRNLFAKMVKHGIRENERRVLSISEAICGVDDMEFLKPIPRKTSPGYPYCLTLKDGKRQIFGATDEYTFDEHYWPKLLKSMHAKEALIKRGYRPLFVCLDFLKDERRTVEKVQIGKTRLVSGSGMELAILTRRYCAGFLNFIQRTKIDNGVAVGTNPYSEDWAKIANHHQYFSGKCKGDKRTCAGDVSGFDKEMHPTWVAAFCDLMDLWYGDVGSETAFIRRALVMECAFSRHVFEDMIYEWIGSNPSGTVLTAILNSIVNIMEIMYVTTLLHAQENGLDFFEAISEIYDIDDPRIVYTCFGDDSLISKILRAHCDNLEWFTPTMLARGFWQFLGIKYTDEVKSTTVGGLRPITECTFLKRGFVEGTGRSAGEFLAPLSLDTILESIRWQRKNPDTIMMEETWVQSVNMMLLELSLHSHTVYNTYQPMIVQAMARTQLRINVSIHNLTQSESRQKIKSVEAYY